MFQSPPRPLFRPDEVISILPPTDLRHLSNVERDFLKGLGAQLQREAASLQRELGASVSFDGRTDGPRWYLGPRQCNPELQAYTQTRSSRPEMRFDETHRVLISDAPDAAGLLQTFSGLRSLHRLTEGTLSVDHCTRLDEAIERVVVGVQDSWAGHAAFEQRWSDLCRQHIPRVRGAQDPIAAIRRWLRPLGDYHTWVRPAAAQFSLPYTLILQGQHLVFSSVPTWTRGYKLGLRQGYRLLGVDPTPFLQTTPAKQRTLPYLVGRRVLSGAAGERRALEARGPRAHTLRWEEEITPPTGTPASYRRHRSGLGILWIGAWAPGLGVESVLEEAFDDLQDASELIVDLRGNTGGLLSMAHRFRDRFLDRERQVGWIRHSSPGRRLSRPHALVGSPSDSTRFHGRVRFLTDPLTYSSSEDALLGLAGQPNVQLYGQPSGGGSGRLRRMPLLPGWRLTISTAITYTLSGRSIEGRGLPLDREFPPYASDFSLDDPIMDAAIHDRW